MNLTEDNLTVLEPKDALLRPPILQNEGECTKGENFSLNKISPVY